MKRPVPLHRALFISAGHGIPYENGFSVSAADGFYEEAAEIMRMALAVIDKAHNDLDIVVLTAAGPRSVPNAA